MSRPSKRSPSQGRKLDGSVVQRLIKSKESKVDRLIEINRQILDLVSFGLPISISDLKTGESFGAFDFDGERRLRPRAITGRKDTSSGVYLEQFIDGEKPEETVLSGKARKGISDLISKVTIDNPILIKERARGGGRGIAVIKAANAQSELSVRVGVQIINLIRDREGELCEEIDRLRFSNDPKKRLSKVKLRKLLESRRKIITDLIKSNRRILKSIGFGEAIDSQEIKSGFDLVQARLPVLVYGKPSGVVLEPDWGQEGTDRISLNDFQQGKRKTTLESIEEDEGIIELVEFSRGPRAKDDGGKTLGFLVPSTAESAFAVTLSLQNRHLVKDLQSDS